MGNSVIQGVNGWILLPLQRW